MPTSHTPTDPRGAAYAIGAFVLWGLFPLYFHLVRAVPPLELVLQRAAWSLVFLLAVLALRGQWAWLGESLRQPRRLRLFALTGALIIGNWLVYVYAMQSQRVAEASLGYFINPLVSVLLGVVVLKEKLRPLQKLAVAVAAAGVLWLTLMSGRLPWIALVLAVSFGLYGLLRKTASLGALEGLALETLIWAPLMLPALWWITTQHNGALASGPPSLVAWLLLAGPLTALPLLLFSAGARRLPLSTLGMVQYVSPTLQLVLALWVFHEPFSPQRLLGFALIWTALAIVSADAFRARAGRSAALVPATGAATAAAVSSAQSPRG